MAFRRSHRGLGGRLRLVVILSLCALALVPVMVRPAVPQLVADLSSHLVAITTGFTGAKVLLFGTTEGEGDVVVVIRGPTEPMVVRRKGRIAGIWVNEAEMVFDEVPSYYALAANRPLSEIVTENVGARHEIGLSNLRLTPPEGADPHVVERFREALIRNMQKDGLYSRKPTKIAFLGSRLFRTDVWFPANAQVGAYTVTVFLVQNDEVVSAEITPLIVSKVGFEAGIFDFAHRHALAYGVLAILIAVVAGWVASTVFHKG